MKWVDLLKIVGNQPVIEVCMFPLSSGERAKLRVQLVRWVNAGKLIKVKRGTYLLSDDYLKRPVQFDYLATFAYRPSYISLEYALSDYGLIPEAVPNVSLITTRRSYKIEVKGKLCIYKHVNPKFFWGYKARGEKNFETFYADPEKALLDYFYFRHEKIGSNFLEEMRIQNTEVLDVDKLTRYAALFRSPKIIRAAKIVGDYAKKERGLKEL